MMDTHEENPIYADDQGRLRITATRVLLDLVVYAYHQGKRPEEIVQMYPTLDLENLYFALAYYFLNRIEVDSYIRRMEQEADYLHQEWEAHNVPSLTRAELTARIESQKRARASE
jgi:uncharacterized protein (DUF433 family)